MSVQTQLNRINSEVISQSTLIAQAIAALEGKAIGGGSSTPSELKTCKIIIQASEADISCSGVVYNLNEGYWETVQHGLQYSMLELDCLPNSIITGQSSGSVVIDGTNYGKNFRFLIPNEATQITITALGGVPEK